MATEGTDVRREQARRGTRTSILIVCAVDLTAWKVLLPWLRARY
jgi:hypothetical protein